MAVSLTTLPATRNADPWLKLGTQLVQGSRGRLGAVSAHGAWLSGCRSGLNSVRFLTQPPASHDYRHRSLPRQRLEQPASTELFRSPLISLRPRALARVYECASSSGIAPLTGSHWFPKQGFLPPPPPPLCPASDTARLIWWCGDGCYGVLSISLLGCVVYPLVRENDACSITHP